MRLIEHSWFIFIAVTLGSAAGWPRPMRKIIYLRRWKIESNNDHAASVCLSDVSRAIKIIHLHVAQRELPPPPSSPPVCLHNRQSEFFSSLSCSYLRRALEMTDGGLKITVTKVAGSIYVPVEFTLQIVSRFVQLRARGRHTCLFAQIYIARQKFMPAHMHTLFSLLMLLLRVSLYSVLNPVGLQRYLRCRKNYN